MRAEPPVLVLVTGLQGTGKSTLAEACAAELGAPVLAWDWAMAGMTWCEPVQDALRSLTFEDHRRVGWSILRNLARAQLEQGRPVVLDGVARDPEVALVRDTAALSGARCRVVLTRCDDLAVVRDRVLGRQRRIPGWYELTWADVLRSRSTWVPPVDVDLVVDTALSPSPEEVARRVLAEIETGSAA